MSEESLERVYTINLGKVLLSPNNQRSKRAINMIREFATRHMKSENVKIEEDVSHLVWARGIRHPPRKIRVKITKDDDGNVLISKYEEEKKIEEKTKEKKGEKKVDEKTKQKKGEKKETKKIEEKPKEEKPKEEKPKEEKPKEEKPKEEKTPAKSTGSKSDKTTKND